MISTAPPALNEEQQLAFDKLIAYITGTDRTHDMMLFSGFAGTGKTFTLSRVVQELQNRNQASELFGANYKVAMSAPTHKAVRVMKRFSRNMPGVTFATIHSLLGLKEEIQRDGKIKFVQSRDQDQIRIEKFNVVFIDEASMLADELFTYLTPQVKRRGLKLVFIGDSAQIPPVNHIDSKPFLTSQRGLHNIGVASLTHIMRQAEGNPILQYATRIRSAQASVGDFAVEEHMVPEVGGIVPVRASDDATIMGIIDKYFVCEEFRQDADHMKVIAWRNVTVNSLNKEVRKRIYKDHAGVLPFLMRGEKLIVDKPVTEGERILLSTNEEIEVVDYAVKTMDVQYTCYDGQQLTSEHEELEYYDTGIMHFDEDGDETHVSIRILSENGQVIMKGILDKIKKGALAAGYPLSSHLWKSFYATQRIFAEVKYNYAITSHKSQGSTYENCMIIDWDLNYNYNIVERNRIRYVAATRARKMLFVVK